MKRTGKRWKLFSEMGNKQRVARFKKPNQLFGYLEL